MTRSYAKELAKRITNEQLKQMLMAAMHRVPDWSKASRGNKGLSRGVCWNLLAKKFNVKTQYSNLHKFNLIREFNEYLPEELQEPAKKKIIIKVSHQEPDFEFFNKSML